MSIAFQKILVPLDGSELANAALSYARLLAAKENNPLSGELVLLRVVPEITFRRYVGEHTVYDRQKMEQEQFSKVDEAAAWLEGIAEELQRHHITARSVVDVGDAAEKIVNFAETNQIGLIVMSTHGHTGLRKLVAGSVASQVSTNAPCPVLLVRAAAAREREKEQR